MQFGIEARDLHGAKSLARGDNKEARSDHQKVRFVRGNAISRKGAKINEAVEKYLVLFASLRPRCVFA